MTAPAKKLCDVTMAYIVDDVININVRSTVKMLRRKKLLPIYESMTKKITTLGKIHEYPTFRAGRLWISPRVVISLSHPLGMDRLH